MRQNYLGVCVCVYVLCISAWIMCRCVTITAESIAGSWRAVCISAGHIQTMNESVCLEYVMIKYISKTIRKTPFQNPV